MKRYYIFAVSFAVICGSVACSTPSEEEFGYLQPTWDYYEIFDIVSQHNKEDDEILDLPLILNPLVANDNGEVCWQYYNYTKENNNYTESPRFETQTYMLVNLLLPVNEDTHPNFIYDYHIVSSSPRLAPEYSNDTWPGMGVQMLHRPIVNHDDSTNSAGYKYAFELPVIHPFDSRIDTPYTPVSHIPVSVCFYNFRECKWYRTEDYILISEPDAMDDNLPAMGGKVKLMKFAEWQEQENNK